MNFLKSILKATLYRPLYNLLIFFVWLMPGNSVGWAIILLTAIVRALLLIPTAKSLKSQAKMQALGPKIEEMKEKYKDDKQAQAKATMDLYKKEGVSPFSSCLPLLIQMMILVVLYKVFMVGLTTSRFGDLLYAFVPHPGTVNTMFLGIDLALKDKLYILPGIAGILQFIAAWQMRPKGQVKDSMQQMLSKQMLFIFPIFTVIIASRLPAALPLYWIVTTIFSVAQQYFVLKNQKAMAPVLAPIAGGKPAETKEAKRGVEITVRRKSR